MNSELITDIVDLARTQGQIDSLIAGLKGVDEAIKNIRPLTDVFKGSQGAADMRKAQADMEEANRRLIETQKQLADAITRINELEQKLASDRVARSKQAMDVYTQLNSQYKDAIRNAQNMAIEYGKESEQALKAAEAAGELKQKLLEVNEAAKSGGSSGKFDPNSVPSVINTGDDSEALSKTGTAITELEEKEAQLANAATAMGQAQLQAGEQVAESGAAIQEAKLKYDQYTGTLRENIEALLINQQLLAENRAAQKDITGSTDAELKQLTALKQEEMDLVEANKALTLTTRNQTKEWSATEGSLDKMQAQLAVLKQSYEKLSDAQKGTPFGQQMLKEVQTMDAAVKNAEKEIGNAQRNVGNYATAFQGAGQKIVQFISRDLLRSIAGFFVFTLAFETLSSLAEKLSKVFSDVINPVNDFVRTQEALKEVNVKAADSVGEITVNVNEMKEKIALAKEGLLDKNKVLEEYNDKIGKTAGFTNDLNKAEKTLIDHGNDIIQLTFLKAKAQAASALAMEQVKRATEDSGKGAEDFVDNWDAAANILRNTLGYLNPFKSDADNLAKMSEQLAKTGTDNKNKDIKDAEDKYKKFSDLQKKFLDEAARYAKDHKLNFFDTDPGSGKKSVDYTAAMMEAEKMLNDAKARYNKSDLEEHAKYDKQLMDDERNSYAIRLAAIKDYYDTQEKLADLSKRKELGDIEIKLNEIAKIEATPAAKRTVEENKLLLQKKAWLQLQKDAEQDYANHVFGIHQELTKKLEDLNDKQNANALKTLQKDIEDFKNGQSEDAFKKQETALDALNEQLKAGTINLEEFKRKHDAITKSGEITQWTIEAESLDKLIGLYNFFGMDTVEMEKKAAQLRKQIKNAEFNEDMARIQKKEAKEKERHALEKELADASVQLFETIGDGVYTKQLNAIQKQIDANTTWKDAEIERINASTLSEQDKAARIAQINAEAQAKQDQLDKQKRDAQLRQAKFDRDMSLLKIVENTYMAVTSDNSNPLTAWKVPYDIALGALAAAEVLAKPLPTYAVGTDFHPGGPAIVGEEGRELFITPSGKYGFTPNGASVMNLERGTKVIPHNEVNKAIQAAMYEKTIYAMSKAQENRSEKQLDQLTKAVIWQTRELKKAYSNKPKIVNNIKINNSMADWLKRNVYN